MKTDFKGHYCRRCHTYSRLYEEVNSGEYRGKCPRCGVKIVLPPLVRHSQLFHSEGASRGEQINLWDAYHGGKIIGRIPAGTPAKVLRKIRSRSVVWFYIQTKNAKGWVSGTFVKKIN